MAEFHTDRRNDDLCVVVHPRLRRESAETARTGETRLEEAVGLVRAINLTIAHAEVIPVPTVKRGTFFGEGVVMRLLAVIEDAWSGGGDGNGGEHPVIVVVNSALSPVQQRNLEKAWNCKVIDRTGLILEIFGERARTSEGRLQVELAALIYQRSRLVRSWTHLERQRGGAGFMGGPGEAQIETDRRLINDRITGLRRRLKDVRRTRDLHRRARRRVPYPIIALVGYTNAGKSTLFNRLTSATVAARDQLFATLDPTMRALDLPSGRKVILSDTVGFISDLPHELVEAFHATLEEVNEADIVAHVRDISHTETEQQKQDVAVVLRDMNLDEGLEDSLIEVLNKVDLVSPDDLAPLVNQIARKNNAAVLISAKTGQGCDTLLGLFDERLGMAMRLHHVSLTPDDGAALSWLYDHGEVLEREDTAREVRLTVRLEPADAARFTNPDFLPESSSSAHGRRLSPIGKD